MMAVATLLLGLMIGFAGGFAFNTLVERPTPAAPVDTAGETLPELALTVAELFKSGDFVSLSGYVHPIYGVVFSPKMTVSLKSCRCLSPADLASLDRDTALRVWGTAEGSAVPLELTARDYLMLYVNDRDYTAARLIGVDYPARVGNALDNTADVFPSGHYVELCCTGEDAASWTTLRLVFEEYEGNWYLTAVIHAAYII